MNLLKLFKTEEKQQDLLPNKINVDAVKGSVWQPPKLTSEMSLTQYKNTVYSCTRLIAEATASTPYRLFVPSNGTVKNFKSMPVSRPVRKQIELNTKLRGYSNYDEILEHPVIDLLEDINDHSNYFDHIYLTLVYLELCGNAYWYVSKDNRGMPESIHLLRPDRMKVITDDDAFIKGYVYCTGVDKIAFARDEIIRFIYPSPVDQFYGMGTLSAAIAASERTSLYDQYENTSLKNNARPDFIVKYNGQLDRAEMTSLTKEWNRLYAGPTKANKIKIMDSDFSIDKLSFSPQEMEYLKGRTMTKKDICQIFGVPLSLLDADGQLKAGIEESLTIFTRFTLNPKLRRLQETLNEFLLPMFDDNLWMIYETPDKIEDHKKKEDAISLFQAGVIDRDEARIMAGIEIQ